MKGFDKKFRDFPDYILGITKEIWEDRGIATLNHYYGEDMYLRMPMGAYRGNQGVIAKTMGTLVEFPDRQLLGEDVIWSGDPEAGMLSSHRLYCTGTHLGESQFGPATGKSVHFRAIADCFAIHNSITDEWLVRDYGGIAKQLGWTAKEAAAKIIEDEGGPDQCEPPTPAIMLRALIRGAAMTMNGARAMRRFCSALWLLIWQSYQNSMIGRCRAPMQEMSLPEAGVRWINSGSACDPAFRLPNSALTIR